MPTGEMTRAPAPGSATPGTGTSHGFRTWLACWLGSAIPLALLFGYIAIRNPRFFFIDDKQAQYAATYQYIGRELLSGRFPLLVPWEGTSANLLLDAQYGLMNPVYWVQNIAFAQFEDMALASLVLAAGYLLVLLAGASAWLLRLGVRPAWAVLGAFAASASGYAIWWVGPSWHPGLVSLAFIPWLGWALAARTWAWPSLVALVAATFATVAGGWPFTVITAGILVAAALCEALISHRRRHALIAALGAVAGALLGAPSLLFTAAAIDWTVRQSSVSNTGFLVPGWADVLNSSMATAAANLPSFSGGVVVAPIMLAGGLSLLLLPFTDLPSQWWRRPGVLTLGLAMLAILVLTQLPADLGPLRWPFRFLGAWQVLSAVTVATALGGFGIVVSRMRILLSLGLLAVFALITLSRTPQDLGWHVVSIGLAAILIGVVILAPQRAALALLLGSTLVMLWAVTARPTNPDLPDWGLPQKVDSYSTPLGTQPQRSLVLYPKGLDWASAAEQGVYLGQNYLLGASRSGLGYSPIGQRPLTPRMATDTHGWTLPPGIDFLLSTQPETGRQWVDLLGTNTITAHRSFQQELVAGLPEQWREAGGSADFVVLQRPADPDLTGRLSLLPDGATAAPVDIADTSQSYDVSSPQGGRVVTADVYWPGYAASWNGEPLAVEPLGESLVAVTVPAGDGRLEITYRPAGTTAAIVSVVLGLLIAALALVLVRGGRPRHAPDPPPASTQAAA